MTTTLEVRRDDPSTTRLAETSTDALADGAVRIEIERFALTANNVTYAVAGDMLGYWDFYPADDGWGRVPAMGWGRVVESNHPEIAVGGRYYGWYPMADTIDIVASPTNDGLRDDGLHRTAHAPVYRSLTRTDLDPLYEEGADNEDRHALLRGLFLTGFLAEAFFADSEYLGAAQTIVLSASSKTAIGFAQRVQSRGTTATVGVTSSSNVDFVRSTGFYDTVVAYDDVASIETADAVVVDMAGNGPALDAVHDHLGDRIQYSMMVGRSHHDAAPPSPSKGPAPQFFFAPTEVTRRLEEWGRNDYAAQTADALRQFVAGSHDWLRVDRRNGAQESAKAWAQVFDGEVAPDVGLVVSLHD